MKAQKYIKQPLVDRVFRVYHKGKKPDEQCQNHKHLVNHNEIIHIVYGKIYLNIDNKKLTLNPGDCVIITGELKHSLKGETGIPYDYLNIMFSGTIPSILSGEKLHASTQMCNFLEILQQEDIYKMPYTEELTKAYLTLFLIHFIRNKDNTIPIQLPESIPLHLYRSDLVRRAMSVIQQEYSRKLDLEKLGKAVGCSKSYLRNLLKKETGESFSIILQKQRVFAAKHLLRLSCRSLEEIAIAVGYDSMPFFFRIFKRWTGMTPIQYSRSLEDTKLNN